MESLSRRNCAWTALAATVMTTTAPALAADASRFLSREAWNCSVQAQMDEDIEASTGPGGMADTAMRNFYYALERTGTDVNAAGEETDSYRLKRTHRVDGKIRLHYVYDGGDDGIQIAGWDNGTARVQLTSHYQGTEQHRIISREKTSSFDGTTGFYGDEYSPGFQLWIYPDLDTYTLVYSLAAVTAREVEHCRMGQGLEDDRQRAENLTDADGPMGGFVSGAVKATCATETIREVTLEGGALSAAIENIPLPRTGFVFEGKADSDYVTSGPVTVTWSCKPE